MVQHIERGYVPQDDDEMEILGKDWQDREPKPEVSSPDPQPFRRKIVWFNAIGFLVLHLLAVHGILLLFTKASFYTVIWTIFVACLGGLGTTMGAHRLYSHKTFKAKPMLRLLLVTLQTLAGQNCMYIWVRDHRQHHKYSDTDGDPHNASRGFFFSHIGWLMSRKHPDVISKGKTIDMTDIEADPFVMFQKKYYKTLYTLVSLGVPVAVPIWLWGEDPLTSLLVAYLGRTVVTLNLTWLVNSAAHKYGNRPYSKEILPVENQVVSMFGFGEGWHNYHHTFPWDYRAAELGQKYNFTTTLLDLFETWGWVYDLRAASGAMVQHRVLKRGDGSHPLADLRPSDKDEDLSRSITRGAGQ